MSKQGEDQAEFSGELGLPVEPKPTNEGENLDDATRQIAWVNRLIGGLVGLAIGVGGMACVKYQLYGEHEKRRQTHYDSTIDGFDMGSVCIEGEIRRGAKLEAAMIECRSILEIWKEAHKIRN